MSVHRIRAGTEVNVRTEWEDMCAAASLDLVVSTRGSRREDGGRGAGREGSREGDCREKGAGGECETDWEDMCAAARLPARLQWSVSKEGGREGGERSREGKGAGREQEGGEFSVRTLSVNARH